LPYLSILSIEARGLYDCPGYRCGGEGHKHVFGFWQGATENHEVCEALLSDLERRGLTISSKILWITDGGKGIIKTLKQRFGKKLIHQRCTIHKDRNIQRHLAKKYRKVRDCEKNIKRYRNSTMSQRWLASALLHCEKNFRRVKGFREINIVAAAIERMDEGIYAAAS